MDGREGIMDGREGKQDKRQERVAGGKDRWKAGSMVGEGSEGVIQELNRDSIGSWCSLITSSLNRPLRILTPPLIINQHVNLPPEAIFH